MPTSLLVFLDNTAADVMLLFSDILWAYTMALYLETASASTDVYVISCILYCNSAEILLILYGYFNLTNSYRRSIVDQCRATFEILTAAPEVTLAA